MDTIKILIIVMLAAIAGSLGKALFHMSSGSVADARHSHLMVRALTFRICLSVALFALLMLAWYFGGLSPNATP